LINKLFNCARVRKEMIYRGEKLEKLGWCATSGTPCILNNIQYSIYNVSSNRLDSQTVNALVSCAEELEFKSRTGQILHRLQTVRYRFNIYANSCVALALWRGVGPRKLVTRFGV